MSEESSVNTQQQPPSVKGEETNIFNVLLVLAKHKRLVLGFPFGVAILAVIISLLMPNVYTGRAVIMPPQQQSSAASILLGQLGALAGGTGAALGLKNPSDLYAGMLKSRTVVDRLIERFKLQDLYEKSTMVETRKSVGEKTLISVGRDGLVAIEFDDEDPKRAAEVAICVVRSRQQTAGWYMMHGTPGPQSKKGWKNELFGDGHCEQRRFEQMRARWLPGNPASW